LFDKPSSRGSEENFLYYIKKGEKIMEYENKHENNFASKGVAGTALGLGIGAVAAEVLGGNLGNILGGGRTGGDGHCINRYEMSLIQESAAKDSKIALLESNIYVDSKIADVYERLNTKIAGLEAQLCEQRVYNATNTAAISCMQGQIAQLASLTKIIIPATSICPPVMPQYNSWTAPTTPTTGA
jgi:hypothetical protein